MILLRKPLAKNARTRTTSNPPMTFVNELLTFLASNGCEDLFGLDTRANYDWTEMTIGESSVVVPSKDNDAYEEPKFIVTAFAFDKSSPHFIVHGRCMKTHTHDHKPPQTPSGGGNGGGSGGGGSGGGSGGR